MSFLDSILSATSLRRSPRVAQIKEIRSNQEGDVSLASEFITAKKHLQMTQGPIETKKGKPFVTLNNRKRRSSDKIVILNEYIHEGSADSGFQSTNENETSSLLDYDLLGLPLDVQRRYKEKRKINTLYDWQKECLADKRLHLGSNMILSLPTGSGKTLIAELLMLRETLVNKRDCILILPYVAIVQEKMQSLAVFEECFNIYVEEYAASKGRMPPIKRRNATSMYICTIEKANMLVNFLIEDNRLDRIGLVVADELHMLGEGSRGATLEQCLSKFLFKQKKQIVGMSATLSNCDEIASFLNAYIYKTDFRPVKLIERVKLNNSLYRVDCGGKLIFERDLGANNLLKKDPDGLVSLLSTLVPTKSVIIFCPTKQNCENVCNLISNLFPKNVRNYRASEREALIEQIRDENDGRVCKVLANGILNGVAYHHSGLTTDERQHVEHAFQTGIICVVCCTSTLAAGVNLPARRVIIKSPYVGRDLISKAQYLQMVGRAGRAGYDDKGDSVTIIKSGLDEAAFRQILSSPLGPCTSNLCNDTDLASFILDLVVLKLACTKEDIIAILSITLLGLQKSNEIDSLLESVIKDLEEKEILKLEQGRIVSTFLGNATFNANLPPASVPIINVDLIKNLHEGIVLASHFHLLFTIIPYDIHVQIDWNMFHSEYMRLAKGERDLLGKMGLMEGAIIRLILCGKQLSTGEPAMRLYIAFMMLRIWNQEPLWEIAERFTVPRGWLQSTLQATCSQAGSIARFAERLPTLWPLKHLLPEVVQRLHECKRPELVPLLAIDCVKNGRAQLLYENNFKTVGSIAKSRPDDLIKAIGKLNMAQARKIINSAKAIIRDQVAEKAEELEAMGADTSDLLSI
uniref:Helicase POLQ-like n=1 Tax=Acrobeloides nanus TaxID=290746 RepID=A0A914CCH5_9BILA